LATVTGAFLSVLLGNGDGTFRAPVSSLIADSVGASLAVGEFNGDGKLDVVATTPGVSSNVFILLGRGDGTFQAPLTFSAQANAFSVTVGDFNGDGKLDLALTSGFNVPVLLGNGDGTFQPPVFFRPRGAFGIAAADLNGDGKLDLVVTESVLIRVLINNTSVAPGWIRALALP
jgi:hypothetical protein